EALRERVQVLESRPGVRQVLLVTDGHARSFDEQHAVIVLGGGGGGFAVTSRDGVTFVHGGLPLAQRQRLANAIGGSVVALSPPTDRPVMDRTWRLSDDHLADIHNAVTWTRRRWPRRASTRWPARCCCPALTRRSISRRSRIACGCSPYVTAPTPAHRTQRLRTRAGARRSSPCMTSGR